MSVMTDLPSFASPPVAEVSVGVQFRPLFRMRGLALAALREQWRADYPEIEEQPALVPVVEGGSPLVQQLQLSLGPLPPVRQWFLNESGTQLVQVQPDRLLVNWRTGDPPTEYPRYDHMRQAFMRHFNDLTQFVNDEGLGQLDITQAELSYINVFDAKPDSLGKVEQFIQGWRGTPGHHLGEPEQVRLTLTFPVVGLGQPPVRMYAEVSPAQKTSGESVLFFTLTVRGNPGGRGLAESLKFFDEAHEHLVRSFAELTEESMHKSWGRQV